MGLVLSGKLPLKPLLAVLGHSGGFWRVGGFGMIWRRVKTGGLETIPDRANNTKGLPLFWWVS